MGLPKYMRKVSIKYYQYIYKNCEIPIQYLHYWSTILRKLLASIIERDDHLFGNINMLHFHCWARLTVIDIWLKVNVIKAVN